MKGILLVDKPSGITSHDVVDAIRKASGIRKVGHTGTLDPAATGLLILCLGPATRLSEHLTGLDKVYEGNMRLGVVSDSFDMDGKILEENPVPELSQADIEKVVSEFTGDLMQVPPMVSAVNVGGERLYKKARKGEVVEREPRKITIHEFEVLDYAAPLAHFKIVCTRGTYVRALCHEVGQKLGCGAVLDSLCRTAVGRYSIEDAAPVAAFENPQDVLDRLVPLGEALDLPEVTVSPAGRRMLASGNALHRRDMTCDFPVHEGWVQVKSKEGELLALAEVRRQPVEGILLPRRVFIK